MRESPMATNGQRQQQPLAIQMQPHAVMPPRVEKRSRRAILRAARSKKLWCSLTAEARLYWTRSAQSNQTNTHTKSESQKLKHKTQSSSHIHLPTNLFQTPKT